MTHDYKELLRTAYEIEGLLLLQIDRKSECSPEVDRMIAEKAAILHSEMNGTSGRTVPAPVATPAPVAAPTAPEPETPITPTPDETLVAESALIEEKEMADPAAQLTLDERIAREKASDISKAFTLNDKFRFRRELFGNSQEEFEDALNVISSMNSLDEAKEYFYEDLCWDQSDDNVKAFMEIIAKHF